MLIGAALAHIVVIAVDGEDLGGSAAGERDADAQRVDLREDGGVERVLHVDVAAVGRGLGPAGDVEREQSVAAGGLPPAEQRDGRVHGERAVGLLELEDAVLEEGARDGGVQLALEALRVQRVQGVQRVEEQRAADQRADLLHPRLASTVSTVSTVSTGLGRGGFLGEVDVGEGAGRVFPLLVSTVSTVSTVSIGSIGCDGCDD